MYRRIIEKHDQLNKDIYTKLAKRIGQEYGCAIINVAYQEVTLSHILLREACISLREGLKISRSYDRLSLIILIFSKNIDLIYFILYYTSSITKFECYSIII